MLEFVCGDIPDFSRVAFNTMRSKEMAWDAGRMGVVGHTSQLLPAIKTLVSGPAVSYEPYSIAGFCYVPDLHIVPNISSCPIQIKGWRRIEHLGRD